MLVVVPRVLTLLAWRRSRSWRSCGTRVLSWVTPRTPLSLRGVLLWISLRIALRVGLLVSRVCLRCHLVPLRLLRGCVRGSGGRIVTGWGVGLSSS